jgi:hypothetical protein
MGHSETIPRFGKVDYFSRQCMKMQKILSEGVLDFRNMEISIQETQCPSKTTSKWKYLMFGGLISWDHSPDRDTMSTY